MRAKTLTIGLWGIVLAIGLASVLTRSALSGDTAALAKSLVLRIVGGELGEARPEEVAALLKFGTVLVFEPLVFIGAMLLLEFRFAPAANAKDYRLAWILQTLVLTSATGVIMILGLLGFPPQPLWKVKADTMAEAILFVLPVWICMLFLWDMLDYWTHRAQHHFSWLWRFHSMHHSQDLDVLHNIAHPIDRLALFLGVSVPAAMLLGVSTESLYLITAFTSLQTHINHTRLPVHMGPLRHILSDNRYHYVHHARTADYHGRNFASRFPIIDRLFGTYEAPPATLMACGLEEGKAPATVRDFLMGRLGNQSEHRETRVGGAPAVARAMSP